ncbi:type II toxin-antitoxin system MqsA family antitoxin [Paraburkholderia fungorum]|uniref:type II toxin-antitoxin system MqsA family antitoxin n=1 Tax=Paraburkholderia fungorum TaxID=134537 RepID=UPI0038B6E4F3
MTCPNRGAAELVRDTRNTRYVYKGETAIFEAVAGDYCPACEEAVLDMDEATRVGQMPAEERAG